MTCFRLLPTRWKHYRARVRCGNASKAAEPRRGARLPPGKSCWQGGAMGHPTEGIPAFLRGKSSNARSLQSPVWPEPWLGRGMSSSQGRRERSATRSSQGSREMHKKQPGELLVWRKSAGRGRRGEQGHSTSRLAQLPGEMLPAPWCARAARTPSVSHGAASPR